MNNAILFFYNLNVEELKKINDNYYFNYQNQLYIIQLYNRKLDEILEIFYLNKEISTKNIPTYEIILTNNNEILFNYNDKYYILMKYPNIKNRIITYQDIINFNISPSIKMKNIDKSNWNYHWSNKIDFIEYQFSQIRNKYKIIDDSIDYYIGMWENAISYYNDNIVTSNKFVSHKRIDINMDMFEFLNPINFVIDYKERDIGEYLKSYVFNNNYTEIQISEVLKVINKRESIILLITRLLFPTYYFDEYEEIVINNKNEIVLKEVIEKQKNINKFLNYIFDYYSKFNITRINWIKKDED